MPVAIPVPVPAAASATPLSIAAFCVLWSSAFAVAKLALADCPPLLLLMARFLLAGAIILVAALILRMPWRLTRRDIAVGRFLRFRTATQDRALRGSCASVPH